MRTVSKWVAAIAALTAALIGPAQAAYPERPITLIVPWGAGGGTDAVARILGTLIRERREAIHQPEFRHARRGVVPDHVGASVRVVVADGDHGAAGRPAGTPAALLRGSRIALSPPGNLNGRIVPTRRNAPLTAT